MPTTHQARENCPNPKKAAKKTWKRMSDSIDVRNITAASKILYVTMAKRAALVYTAHAKSKTAAHLYKNR